MQAFAPEFRQLVQAASCFVTSECDFMFFYYACANAVQWAKFFPPEKRIGDLITEWNQQAERCRNEWGYETQPSSEAEFKSWLTAQLALVDMAPMDRETAWT